MSRFLFLLATALLVCPIQSHAEVDSGNLLLVSLNTAQVLAMNPAGEAYIGFFTSTQGGPWEALTALPTSIGVAALARVDASVVVAITDDFKAYRGAFASLPGVWETVTAPPTQERIIGFASTLPGKVLLITESGRAFEGYYNSLPGFWLEVAAPPSVVDAQRRSLGDVKRQYR